jgi:DNA-damage-inducible protein J
MEQTDVRIRMDADLKQKFEEFCGEIGLTMSAAVSALVEKTLREEDTSFSLAQEPNQETKQAILEAREGIGLSRGFSSVRELMEDLNSYDPELDGGPEC